MFNLDEAIVRWRQEMISAGVTRAECLDELELHLREDVERSTRSGGSPELAFERAVQRLGERNVLAAEFQKSARAERRQSIYRGLLFGVGVFVFGTVFCYFVVLPLAMSAEALYMKWLGFAQLRVEPRAYLRFAAKLILGLSLSLEVPVILLTLVKVGVVDHHLLSKGRKYVLPLNLVVAAIIAGPAMIPELIIFLLLQGWYELSVWLARVWENRDKRLGSRLD